MLYRYAQGQRRRDQREGADNVGTAAKRLKAIAKFGKFAREHIFGKFLGLGIVVVAVVASTAIGIDHRKIDPEAESLLELDEIAVKSFKSQDQIKLDSIINSDHIPISCRQFILARIGTLCPKPDEVFERIIARPAARPSLPPRGHSNGEWISHNREFEI